MNIRKIFLNVCIFLMLSTSAVFAKTQIEWWHAFGGRLGELLDEQVQKFNASQNDYEVVHTRKGNYSETLNAGIAAFRAKQQPHLLMVFEVGTATMMAAKGAIKPVYEVMAESGLSFNADAYIPPVKGYYTTTDGKMLSLPYNSSTPVLWVNRDLMKKAGLNPDMSLATWSDSALHVKHLEMMGNWAKDGKFFYAGRRNEGGANFRAGECMFFTESSAGYAGIKKEAKFDFEIRPLPYHAGTKAPQNTIIGGSSLWVMTGHSADEYKGVATFINFLSGTDIQSKWHQDTGYLPITIAASEKTAADGFYNANPGTDIAGNQMMAKAPTENSKGLRLGSFDQIRGIIDEELEAIWTGSKSAQVAMDSAVKRGDALLRRFEKANK